MARGGISTWTVERDLELLRLRNDEKKIWTEIASIMGKTDKSCRDRYFRIPGARIKSSRCVTKWTSESERELLRLRRNERKTTKEIAEITGRTMSSVQSRLDYLAHRETRAAKKIIPIWIQRVPPLVLEDRDRRASAQRDPASVLCGDPPPGQSALDKRQMETA